MKKIRVLVVDDAAFMRDMIKKGVRAAFPGFRLDEAAHGRQAMHFLERHKYDLVLCDWEMPEMNGAELLEWMRNEPKTENIPFVMVTSRGDREHVSQAIELKVSNYIVKPFTNEKLIRVVTNVMTKALGVSADTLRHLAGKAEHINFGLSGAVPVSGRIEGGEMIAEGAPSIVKPREKVLLPMRFQEHAIPVLIKEISLETLVGVIRRSDKLPAIMEMVVVDVDVEGAMARLNGYVHSLQARDNSQESEFINMTVYFVDQDDGDKMEHLDNYLNSIA